MSDIAKCTALLKDGSICFRTDTCWRYIALADELYQSYISAQDCVDNDYAHYWNWNETP